MIIKFARALALLSIVSAVAVGSFASAAPHKPKTAMKKGMKKATKAVKKPSKAVKKMKKPAAK